MNVERGAVIEGNTGLAGITGLAVFWVLAIDGFCQDAGAGGLAHTPRTAKQKCMRQLLIPDGIPQGGGDYMMGHRCAGEWVTIEVMKVSLDFLSNRMEYLVPEQDLSFSRVSMPSIPHSKVVIKNVKQMI